MALTEYKISTSRGPRVRRGYKFTATFGGVQYLFAVSHPSEGQCVVTYIYSGRTACRFRLPSGFVLCEEALVFLASDKLFTLMQILGEDEICNTLDKSKKI